MVGPRSLTPQLARALIRSLNRGTAVAQGARFIHVGQREWLAAQLEMLDEVAEDGHPETKFVRGAYGSGKSHFLSVVQDFARERQWTTAHIECKTDKVEIDRFETLYPKIVEKLLTPDSMDGIEGPTSTAAPVDAAGALLDKWSKKVLQKSGIRENALSRPFDADERVYGYFERELFRSSLPSQFVHAALAYCRALLEKDVRTTSSVVAWFKGGLESLSIPAAYISSPKKTRAVARDALYRPIGKGTAHDAMRALLWLIRDAGYAGLVLCIDEVEELARLGTQKRQDQALQALREFVDHAGGEGGYRSLCMYLAATPEMFESDRYFPRYDALATRIQPLGDGLNWRGPVIDLEKKPLTRDEMASMADGIVQVYAAAYGDTVSATTSSKIVAAVVDGAIASRQRLAKPRLLARMLVDELEHARNDGTRYQLPADLVAAAARAAASVLQSTSL
jgi:BREX system ATP-binding protein BrxC/D